MGESGPGSYHRIGFEFGFVGHRHLLLERGMLHRDVCLEKILFDSSDEEMSLGRLIYFELAKDVREDFGRIGMETQLEDDLRRVPTLFNFTSVTNTT
jgi:Fungal protein kinase